MSISSLVQQLTPFIGKTPNGEFNQIVRKLTEQGVQYIYSTKANCMYRNLYLNALYVYANLDGTIESIYCNTKDKVTQKSFTKDELDLITQILSMNEDDASARVANNPTEFVLLQQFRDATNARLNKH